MAELPENTLTFLGAHGYSAERIGEDAWILRAPKRAKIFGTFFQGGTITSETKFPEPLSVLPTP